MPRLQRSLTKLIIGDAKWWIAEPIIALAILVVASLHQISQSISGDATVVLTPFGSVWTKFQETLHLLDGYRLTPTVVTLLFWGGIGAIVYTIVLHIVKGINEFADAAEVAGGYHHPKWYNSHVYWVGVAKAWLFWWASFLAAVLLLLVSIFLLWPFAIDIFQVGLKGLPNWQALAQMLVGWLVGLVGVRLINIAIHIFFPSLNQFEDSD